MEKRASFFLAQAAFISLALIYAVPCSAALTLINPGFEDPRFTPGVADFQLIDAGSVPGWSTTAGDNLIELWSDGHNGVYSYEGDQHAELNADQPSTLYQDLTGVPAGGIVSFHFAHRGRDGVDTLRMTITDLGADGVLGGGDDTVLFTKEYSTGNTAWHLYTSSHEQPIVALGHTMRIAFEAVSTATGNPTQGNFLDAVDFGVGVTPYASLSPIPTLGDFSKGLLIGLLALMGMLWTGRRSSKER